MLTPRHASLLIAALAMGALSSCSSTSLSLYYGERSIEEDTDDISEPPVVGIEAVLGILPFGLGIEVAYFRAEDDGTEGGLDIDAEIQELAVGLRKTFRESKSIRPYIGGGLSYLDSEITLDDASEDDGTGAYYLHAGVGYHILFFSIGLDYRVVGGTDASFGDEDIDLNYDQITAFIGVSF
jgi:hypothetical protein